MNKDQASGIITKLFGMYNKEPAIDQITSWLEEIKKLDEPPAQKVLANIKSNPYHVSLMPNIPQFLALYKTYIAKNENVNNKEYCYVCCNKGIDSHIKELHGYLGENRPPYVLIYQLYCDCCEKGKSMMEGLEPISKYFDVTKIAEYNKSRLANVIAKPKTSKNTVKVVSRLWSMQF